MQLFIKIFLVVFVSASIGISQERTREQKINDVFDLRSQISSLESEILQPDPKDFALGRKQGFNVIRLLPREKYDHVLSIRGGGAYYSFVRKTHEYGYGSDISLEQGNLRVGFAGADYGFLIDLGELALSDVGDQSPGLDFLAKYVPPAVEPAVRIEQRKSYNYPIDGLVFKSSVPAISGHTYALRSIVFSSGDVLVVFSVQRKDLDGSLIIFWKPVETFAKPEIRPESIVSAQ